LFVLWQALSFGGTLTVQPAGNEGFDIFADGKLVAPVRTNGVITAGKVEKQGEGLRLSDSFHSAVPACPRHAPSSRRMALSRLAASFAALPDDRVRAAALGGEVDLDALGLGDRGVRGR
jgi:hypothetical protein